MKETKISLLIKVIIEFKEKVDVWEEKKFANKKSKNKSKKLKIRKIRVKR
jgi:hypothetical protein